MNLLPFYGDVSKKKTSDSSSGGSSGSQSPLEAKSGIQNIGLAVFSGDKMVGKLTAIETMCNLIVTNELRSCNLTINDPDDDTKIIDLFLTLDRKPKINVDIINGTPYVKANIKVNARIASISDAAKDMDENRIKQIEELSSNYLNNLILNYFYKTSKSLGCDVADIGKYALKNFKTVQEFENYNWLEKYDDAFFNITTDVNVKSNFLLTGS